MDGVYKDDASQSHYPASASLSDKINIFVKSRPEIRSNDPLSENCKGRSERAGGPWIGPVSKGCVTPGRGPLAGSMGRKTPTDEVSEGCNCLRKQRTPCPSGVV